MAALLLTFVTETIHLWLEMSFYILIGLLLAGLLHVFLGKEFISRHLGKAGFLSILKATIIGIPLPICSCGVIPLASSLKKEGAHRSSVLSFLVSTPTTGVDSIFATYSLLGPLFAIFRPLAALCSGVLVGCLDYLGGGRKEKEHLFIAHAHKKMLFSFKMREFLRYSFREIPQDIGKWLILGTIIGGALSALVPPDFFPQYFSFPLDFLIALAVGIPLYVCATGSIPIAASLIAKGFTPGAGLVFLIAGPATNIVTISFVRAKLGKKPMYLYLISIIAVALLMGLLFNMLWKVSGSNPAFITGAGEHVHYGVKALSGILLLLLVLLSFVRHTPVSCEIGALEVKVPDLHCGHCKLTVEGALRLLPEVEDVLVEVQNKRVFVKGTVDKEKIIATIKEAGYHPVEDGKSANCG